MSWHAHADASETVRRHWRDAECFLVAQAKPCIDIRDDEIKHVDRLIHGGVPDDLNAWTKPRIWFVGVIVCPGDDLGPLAEYVLTMKMDPHRIHFYLHPDTAFDVFAPWIESDLPLDRVEFEGKGGEPLDDWRALHSVLGRHLNAQILSDVLGS